MRYVSFAFFILFSGFVFSKEEHVEELNKAYQKGDLETIKGSSEKLIQFDDYRAYGFAGLGHYYFETGDYPMSISYYEKANAIMPAFEAFLKISEAHRRMGNYDLELMNLNKAIVHETYYSPQLKQELFNIGILDTMDTTVLILRNSNSSLKRKIEWFANRNQYDSALMNMMKVVDWDSSAINLYTRGLLFLENKNYEKAIIDFNSALAMDEEFNRMHILLRKAYALGKLGRIEESMSLFDSVEVISNTIYPELFWYKGRVLLHIDENEKGCELINRAGELGIDISEFGDFCDL